MYKIVTINNIFDYYIEKFNDFNTFIEKLTRLVKANKTLDVYINNEMVATASSGELHQFKKIKKILDKPLQV